MEVKEKKVELIELFYDLIYVYAISRMTLLVEEPIDGVIDAQHILMYIFFSLLVFQAWLMMTTYVNRYGTWRWYEYVLAGVNMVAVMFLTNTIDAEWTQETASTFNSAMLTMMLSVAVLYAIQVRIEKQDVEAAKNSLFIIAIVSAMYAFSASITFTEYYRLALIIDVAAVVLGAILPSVFRKNYDPAIVSFPHLVERLELFTILTFGESIVGMAKFFDVTNVTALPFFMFMFVLLMFGNYVVQVHYVMNHHRINDGRVLTHTHYFMVIAINMMTVSLLFYGNEEADRLFTSLMLIASQFVFYIALEVTSYYNRPQFRFSWKEFAASMIVVAIGGAIIVGFMDYNGFIIGALFTSVGNFYIKWRKFIKNRKAHAERPVQ